MKTVHLLTLMRNVLKTAGDFWSRYQCDEMFDIKYVTVDSEYARQNILTEMLQRSLCLAHILGLKVSKTLRISFTQRITINTYVAGLSYNLRTFLRLKAAKAEASSIYSQSAFRKLGFETLACYPYEDYCGKDSDGNNVFSGTGIHKTIDFMSRKIPCFKNTIL